MSEGLVLLAGLLGRITRSSLNSILGTTLSNTAWFQATLPLRHGGLGLLSPSRLAQSAFAGSLLFTQQLLERHINPNNPPLHLSSLIQDIRLTLSIDPGVELPNISCQKFLSDLVHQRQHWISFPNSHHHHMTYVISLSLPTSTTFLQAFPNHHMGTRLIAQEFCFAIKWLLGVPIISQSILCPACQEVFDVFGDHALCCKQGND